MGCLGLVGEGFWGARSVAEGLWGAQVWGERVVGYLGLGSGCFGVPRFGVRGLRGGHRSHLHPRYSPLLIISRD